MRTVRHSVKQPNISAKTMRNYNNKIWLNIQNTIIVPILPQNHRQCAKTQHECTRMRNSHNKIIASLYKRNAQCTFHSEIFHSCISQLSSRESATHNNHTMCHVGAVHCSNQHTWRHQRRPQWNYVLPHSFSLSEINFSLRS